MEFIQSTLRKLLLALVALAGPAQLSVLDVPRLVAQVRTTQAGAAAVAGRWHGTSGQGRQVRLELKTEGSALTGTLTLDDQSGGILDGTIDRHTISFKATLGGRTAQFTGALAGDDLVLTLKGARNPVTLSRVK